MLTLTSPKQVSDNERKSYKIIGLPGTGKTYTLLQIVKNYVSDGIDMKQIIYCSHTKAAIGEVQERIVKLLPHLTNKDLKSIKTMHALSFSLVKKELGNKFKKSDMTKERDTFFKDFQQNYRHKFTFLKFMNSENSPVYDLRYLKSLDELTPSIIFSLHENIQIKFPDGDIDGIFRHLKDYWSKLSIDDDDEYDYTEDDDFEDLNDELTKMAIQCSFLFHQQWSLHKQQHNIFGFNDLLLYCYRHKLIPNCTILIMDEFQDFSPLQYEVFKVWSDATKISIIAGDPNQAIYGFQNSSPQFLIEFESSEPEIILDVSYRLPPKIIELAQKMITSNTYLSSYQSHVSINREGSVEVIDLSDIEIDPEESVFVLCRTNSMIETVGEQLRKAGIANSTSSNDKENGIAIREIERYYEIIFKLLSSDDKGNPEKNDTFNNDEIRLLLKLNETPQNFDNVVNIGIRKSLLLYQPYHNLLNLLDEDKEIELDKNLLLSLIDLEHEKILPLLTRKLSKAAATTISKGIEKGWNKTQLRNSLDQVKVMTIHKSKGKEADLVIVINRATHYEKRGEEDEEEERRIWYVAVTRAKSRLIIASYDDEMEYTKTKYVNN